MIKYSYNSDHLYIGCCGIKDRDPLFPWQFSIIFSKSTLNERLEIRHISKIGQAKYGRHLIYYSIQSDFQELICSECGLILIPECTLTILKTLFKLGGIAATKEYIEKFIKP